MKTTLRRMGGLIIGLAFSLLAGAQGIDATLGGSGWEVRSIVSNGGIRTVTWAGKPSAAATAAGSVIRVSDVGVAPGAHFVSDGTRWLPDGPQQLARSCVAASVTASTSEEALATITIPAGAMGLNGGVRLHTSWSYTSSANTKTMRVRLGGISGTAFMAAGVTTNQTGADMRFIRNRNSASSQVGSFIANNMGGTGQSGSAALPTGTIDTSAAVDLVISGQKASSGETLTLDCYEVWLLP